MNTQKKTCCVFGHRKISEKDKLKEKLSDIFEKLIDSGDVDTFLLGSKSEFNELCRDVLAVKKEKHPHIQRVYVRGEYPYIDEDYENYLLERCEKTYFPKRAINAGRFSYIQRNYDMIDKSDICVIYFKKEYLPIVSKSGTETAYKYALRKKRTIINLAEDV